MVVVLSANFEEEGELATPIALGLRLATEKQFVRTVALISHGIWSFYYLSRMLSSLQYVH
jgi:hypothetical protein